MSEKFKYTVGLHNVGSYQVAGSPYVTASTVSQDTETQIEFPNVTNNVTVKLDSSAGGSGTTYNSVEISGLSVYYQNSTTNLAADGDDRTITTWISASVVGATGQNNGLLIGGTTVNNQFCIREKSGQPFQAVLRDQASVKSIGGISFPSGWFHLALVASSSAYFRVFINGAQEGNVAISTTDGDYLGGGLVLGPNGSGDTNLKFRDAILWDAALTNSQISDLYDASGSYSDPAFSVANKLVWVKPDDAIASSPVNTLVNSGDASYGNMSLNNYDGSDTAQVVADAPFADISGGGSGGELRIHYRSTGSLPNVEANKHYWTLSSQDEEIKMNVKTKEIYLSAVDGDCDFSLHADLTNIPASRMYQHTGSGVDE